MGHPVYYYNIDLAWKELHGVFEVKVSGRCEHPDKPIGTKCGTVENRSPMMPWHCSKRRFNPRKKVAPLTPPPSFLAVLLLPEYAVPWSGFLANENPFKDLNFKKITVGNYPEKGEITMIRHFFLTSWQPVKNCVWFLGGVDQSTVRHFV